MGAKGIWMVDDDPSPDDDTRATRSSRGDPESVLLPLSSPVEEEGGTLVVFSS